MNFIEIKSYAMCEFGYVYVHYLSRKIHNMENSQRTNVLNHQLYDWITRINHTSEQFSDICIIDRLFFRRRVMSATHNAEKFSRNIDRTVILCIKIEWLTFFDW